MRWRAALRVAASVIVVTAALPGQAPSATEIAFAAPDGTPLRGRLVLPAGEGPHPVIVYAQAAEGMTIDMRRPLPGGASFSYFDIYRQQLPPLGVGFFSYEGRGITAADAPPRYERIDSAVYNTSTLSAKAADLVAAVEAVAGTAGVDPTRIFAMGASEGTLIATEGAALSGGRVAGLILYGLLALNMRDNFRFILTDGAFITYRRFLDTDGDGRVTRAEWDADPRGWRQGNLPGVAWEQLEVNRDGSLTVEDIATLQRPFLDGLDRGDFAILDAWSRRFASVALPAGWWQDHFAHPTLPTFLARLDIPIGIFHGEWDNATPVRAVRELEARLHREGTHQRIEIHYLDTDHTLNVGRYFRDGTIPAGHQAIFDYVRRVVATGR